MNPTFQNSGDWQGSYISTNPIERFLDAIAQAGLPLPTHIVADGAIHRYRDPAGKPGNKHLWYVLYLNATPAGAFGDWKSGYSRTWSARSKQDMTPTDRTEYRLRMDEVRRQRKESEDRKHTIAASKARDIWGECQPAHDDHPYLLKKGVTAGIARQSWDALVLPILTRDKQIKSLQFIHPDGAKRMLTGGEKKGNFIPCSDRVIDPSRVIVCEGWATGRTLAELDPTAIVIAAIDAGNLESVAMNARIKWPVLPLVIACDDDRLTVGNPGMTKGRSAAIASGAKVMRPKWPDDSPLKLSDFNDLQQWLKQQGGAA